MHDTGQTYDHGVHELTVRVIRLENEMKLLRESNSESSDKPTIKESLTTGKPSAEPSEPTALDAVTWLDSRGGCLWEDGYGVWNYSKMYGKDEGTYGDTPVNALRSAMKAEKDNK